MEIEDKKDYHKKYYLKHCEKMKAQIKERRPDNTKRIIIKKLNNNEYKRIPHAKLQKYNINFNEEKKIYF